MKKRTQYIALLTRWSSAGEGTLARTTEIPATNDRDAIAQFNAWEERVAEETDPSGYYSFELNAHRHSGIENLRRLGDYPQG